MSRKKQRSPAEPAVAVKAAPSPGLWETTLAPLLQRHALAIAMALIAIGGLRIALNWSNMGLTNDEPGHMACGLQYWADHVYRYESQHPPLARLATSLGPFLAGARPLHGSNQDQEGVNVIYHTPDPGRTVMLMRAGVLPFFLLGAAAVFLWARRYFGGPTAVLSALLFTLTPMVLAHGGLATTDMPAAGALTASFFLLLVWAEEPSWMHSVLWGLATAMAFTAKFTPLGFLPAAAVFAAAAWVLVKRPGGEGIVAAVKVRALPCAVAVLTAAIAIWGVYGFRVGPVKAWGISLPAPELFDGIGVALYHNQRGHGALLLGEIRNTGWWYFFPLLLAVKTPLGILALSAIGLGVVWARRLRLEYWMPVAFAAGVLLPSMTSHVNIGLRHVLPMFSGIAIVAAIGLVWLAHRASAARWAAVLAVGLPVWALISGAAAHPDYVAYFNELAGSHPERIVVDSDLDWGQNTVRLARRLKELGAAQVAYTDINTSGAQLQVWPGLPPSHYINPLLPTEGWTAVSPSIWMLRRYGLSFRDSRQPWWVYTHPQEKVGTLWMYYVPPGSLPVR